MKKIKLILFFSLCSLLLFSCKSVSDIQKQRTNKIVTTAKKYLGTKYKYGGINKRGMDCSGLVYTSFSQNNLVLPRTAYAQSKQGKQISLKNTDKGDLLFFKTLNSKHINHVGIVTNNSKGNIQFIHASTSEGVIISSINDKYWKRAFIKSRRIIDKPNYKSSKKQIHFVKSGDTLYDIAKKYNTTVSAIKKLNHLKSNIIKIGMELRVL